MTVTLTLFQNKRSEASKKADYVSSIGGTKESNGQKIFKTKTERREYILNVIEKEQL